MDVVAHYYMPTPDAARDVRLAAENSARRVPGWHKVHDHPHGGTYGEGCRFFAGEATQTGAPAVQGERSTTG